MQLYESEQDKERTLGSLEPINPDDLVLEENVAYAAALLKNFFKNKKILLEEEDSVNVGEEPMALRATNVADNNDSLSVKYEYSFEIEGQTFTEILDISVKFGTSKDNLLTLCLVQESGNWLYFKKVAKEIRKLLTYCRK